ncbi:hypothetical protein RRG08_028561 [Elysia crispata]|uniref:Uncharacterized protein n=1 Tax=Elysia crispata TaxID=231223 RepID=A0AAE0YAE9_9GAST|nr:hypothetical protein RRG08_028561 [Elysia crispata]
MRLSLVMETQTSSLRRARDQAVLSPYRQTDLKKACVRPGSVSSHMEENATLSGDYSAIITATQPVPKSNVSLSTHISFLSPGGLTPISTVFCPADKHLVIPSTPRPASNFKYPTDSLVIAHAPPHSNPHSSIFNPSDCHRYTQGIPARTWAAPFLTEKHLGTLTYPGSTSAVSCPRDSCMRTATYCTPNSWGSHPIDINAFAAPERRTIGNIQSRSDVSHRPHKNTQAGRGHIVTSTTPKSCRSDFYTLDNYNLTPPTPEPRFDFHPMSRHMPGVPYADEKKSYGVAFPHPCSDVLCPAHRHSYTSDIQNLSSDLYYLGDRKRFTVERPGPYPHSSSRRLFDTDEAVCLRSCLAASQKN